MDEKEIRDLIRRLDNIDVYTGPLHEIIEEILYILLKEAENKKS